MTYYNLIILHCIFKPLKKKNNNFKWWNYEKKSDFFNEFLLKNRKN